MLLAFAGSTAVPHDPVSRSLTSLRGDYGVQDSRRLIGSSAETNLTQAQRDLFLAEIAQTLQEIQFDDVFCSPGGGPTDTIFDSASILRIVDGCPSLLKVTWNAGDLLWDSQFEGCEPDTSKTGRIDAILKSRGGQLSTDVEREFWWKSPPPIEPAAVDY